MKLGWLDNLQLTQQPAVGPVAACRSSPTQSILAANGADKSTGVHPAILDVFLSFFLPPPTTRQKTGRKVEQDILASRLILL